MNLALAQMIDPEFASLTKELIVMGGSIHPMTDDPEFATTPRREFNFWLDPESSYKVFHSPWPRIVVPHSRYFRENKHGQEFDRANREKHHAAAQYVAKYAQTGYLWDELAPAAWLDQSIITKTTSLYMDISVDQGPSYGDT